MASSSETGHNKNVANFSKAYQILEEMETLYNPSNPNISLANLVPIKGAVAETIKALNNQIFYTLNCNTLSPLYLRG
jgi:hypothetical protein